MASKLASQLQALAVSGGGSTYSKPAGRPSLLFHPSEAANIDAETILTLAQTNVEKLAQMDTRFKAFRKTLFTFESSQLDRELQSKEFNENLNKSLATFFRLLSGYVMLSSTHQILEYLIRRYKVQIYNVEDVILCVLPYHETSLFVRVVQLLQIKNTRWQFLEAVQSTGAAPPRTVLVQRCTYDMAFLESICGLAMAVSGIAAKSKTTISFVSVVLIETLAEVPTVSTDLVNKILPFILQSFEEGISEEYSVGALMIIGALANRTSLARSLVEKLFHDISRAFQKGSDSGEVSALQLHIMVMIQLVQTQQIDSFPSKPFKLLLKVRHFIPILTDLMKIFDMGKFLTFLLQMLIEHCVQHEHYEDALLDAIKSLPVANQVVSSVLRLLEISFDEGDKAESQVETTNPKAVVKKMLQAIEKRFPAELDKAIALHFQNSKEVHKGKKKDDPVFTFLLDVFHGSLRVPLAETHMSLYLSLDHPEASMRETAIKQLSKIASTIEPTDGAEIYAVLREAYLRRLSDDDYHVIRAVLSLDNLVSVLPAERLLQALASIISRTSAELMAGETSSKGDVKAISKLVINVLASEFLVQHPGYVEQVAFVLFEHLYQRPLTWRINMLVLKAAGTIPFHLFMDLTNVYEEASFGTDEKNTKSKGKHKLWQAATNGKIIKSLAAKLSDGSTALLPAFLKPSLSDNAKLLMALTLLQCFKLHFNGLNTKLVEAGLQWLRDEWTTLIGSGKDLPLAELQKIDYADWDDLNSAPPGFYHQLEINSKIAYAEVLLRALHNLVTSVPNHNSVKFESDARQDPMNELFVLFAGSSSLKIFSAHINLLLDRLPAPDVLPFLSKFFIAEGSAVPALVQVHSLDVLASQLLSIAGLKSKAVDHVTYTHLQSVLPPVLVALASPLRAVRRSASNCVEQLSSAWGKHSLGKDKGVKGLKTPNLNPRCFEAILQVLVGAKATIISSGSYIEDLFKEKFGLTKESEEDVKMRAADEVHAIVAFFVNHAFHLSVYGQRVVFRVLQGVAYDSELARATHERLSGLVECRKLAHLQKPLDRADEKLTHAEVQLLEVLLQIYTSHVPAEFSEAPGADGEDFLSSFFDCFSPLQIVALWEAIYSCRHAGFFYCLSGADPIPTIKVEGGSLVDPAVLQPCSAALKCVTPDFYSALSTPGQDVTFQALISLSTVNCETVRSLAHVALRNIKISASTVSRHLEHILEEGLKAGSTERKKKRRKTSGEDKIVVRSRWPASSKLLISTTTILEVLVWKSDMEERHILLIPLFKLLRSIVNGVWPQIERDEEGFAEGSDAKEDLSPAAVVLNAEHLIFMILENIIRSLTEEVRDMKDLISQAEFDVNIVVTSVNKADGVTRDHALALLTSLARLIPDAVLQHLIDIVSVVGESTLTQDDSYSHQVVYDMLTAVVPGWLAVKKDPTPLLQVFVNTLPRIPKRRRMDAVINLLRVTTEEVGLHIFLFLLLQKTSNILRNESLSSENATADRTHKEKLMPLKILEQEFAALLCRQYSLSVKLPAMVKMLDISKVDSILNTASSDKSAKQSGFALQQLVTQFIADQLQSSQLPFGVQLDETSNTLQKSFVALMEQVLLQLQTLSESHLLPLKLTSGVQEAAISLLDGLTLVMPSPEYIKGISSLMKHSDTNIRRRVLRMYSSKLKELDRSVQVGQSKKKKKQVDVASLDDEHLTAEELELRAEIIKDITGLVAGKEGEDFAGYRLAAIEALNLSSQRFAEKMPDIFVSSLTALVANFQLTSRTAAAAVKCVATILDKLGPHALPALPETVSALFEIAEQALAVPAVGNGDGGYEDKDVAPQSELIVAIIETLKAMIDKLGGFLTPYLQKIVGLVLLRPQLIQNADIDIVTRAAAVRMLLPTRIPARLLIDPLLSTYESAIETGEDSTCALFDMLATMTTKADRSSVAAYHKRIFEFCLTAFDLRARALATLWSISRVEAAVIHAVISLVMKLSETTFKPLFVRILEWAESEAEVKDGLLMSQSVHRNIVFYKLVNQLTAKLRSVFVPYLQYLINGCVHHLTGGLSKIETLKPKKKKRKQSGQDEQKVTLSSLEWHLRQLILSSLHQCFLYDTISFLDAPRFQLLLGPVVSQLMVEAPTEVPTLKQEVETTDIPSLQEMDDTLVSCLGQMALTAGTDLLWKPLNHEVLMCTRVENVRTRLLGLRVVKFLAEHLKEEYLVLLPETIPFLAELLEDTELAVVAKTQEVVKFLEDLSGEDLAQYF